MPAEMKTSRNATVFMGSDREIAFEDLSKTTSAKGGKGLWSRSLEEEYLERVQRRAAQEVREMLARGERDRAAMLAEAEARIAEMWKEARLEIEAEQREAGELNAAAVARHEEAKASYAGAREEGYNAGLARAQEDLENFRSVIGESVGAVLGAVQEQCTLIFESWREELCALVPLCVEKGLAWVLNEERAAVLENLLRESVRLLERGSGVTVRVHPDDEAAVTDMFAAAEQASGFEGWTVSGDPAMTPGSLVLESARNRVESRAEERKAAVDAALRHLTLPPLPEEEAGMAHVAEIGACAEARVFEIAPKRAPAEDAAPKPEPEKVASEAALDLPETQAPGTDEMPEETFLDAAQTKDAADGTDAPETPETALEAAPPPKVDLSVVWAGASKPDAPKTPGSPPDAGTQSNGMDGVLAEGGFLPLPENAR